MTYSLFKRVQSILLCAMMMISLLADIPVSAEGNECPLYGQHKLDGAVMFEAKHPHEQYVVCDCGFAQYTGSTMDYYAECETCNPQECQHTNTAISWDSNYKMNPVPISETQHQITGYQYKYCTSCFEHIGSSFEATEIYNHDFNSNGDCPTCGYTHACKHSRTKLVVIDGYPAYSQYNETQHIVDIQYKEMCLDCNDVVNQIVDSAREYKHEDHDFNKKGVCRDCGYVKLEEQEELKISVSANQSSAEIGSLISASASASGGDGSYSFAWSVTCNGSTVADTDSGYGDNYSVTANKAGSYVFTATVHDGNGNQVSGSSGTITVEEPACQHPTLEVAWDTYSAVSVSDTEHELTGYQHHYCTVCFEPVGSSFAATERVGHDFNSNGDCPTCGYTYKCKHTNTKFVPIDGYPTYHQHDEKQHIYDVRFKEVCTNPTCGTTVKDLVDSERIYEHQDHRFDENGKCQDCGYIKQEAQVPLEVAVSRGQASAQTGETITAKALAIGGDGNYKYSWKVLLNGEEIQVTDLQMGDSYSWRADTAGTYTFSVTVLDGNNDSVTGSSQEIVVSQSKCMHETYTDIPGTVTYEQLSDAKHNKITLMSRVCDICREPIGEYKKEESENHTFANGICSGCGLAEPTADCQHEHAEEKLTDSKISNQGDTNQHIVTETYSVVCQDCGITVRTFEKKALEDHAFNADGVCACGYAKPTPECDHANRTEVQIGTPTYVNNSEKGHTKTVKVRVECADCGIVLEEEKTVTTTENHKYENGVCVCGQAEHVHTYEKVVLGQSGYVNQNTSEHDVTVTYVMKCSGCGDTTAQQTETIREAHIYTTKGRIETRHQAGLGHATFDRCVCGAVRYTGYAKYNNCCDCYGHSWGNAYEQNGQWLRKCVRCGNIETTEAPNKTDPATCVHVWDDGHYREEHPHNLIYTCKKCGFVSETAKFIQLEDCCDCVGHLFLDDDYSRCLRCGKVFRCEHQGTVTYSEHPHAHVYWSCEIDGISFELEDQFRPNGRELSWCTKCFPQNRIDNDHLVNMAELTQVAYDTGAIVDSAISQMGSKSTIELTDIFHKIDKKDYEYRQVDGITVSKTSRKGIYSINSVICGYETGISTDQYQQNSSSTMHISGLRITEESGFPDSYIEVTNTADGELILTIAFEGTQELGDALTDASTKMNSDGVHRGFAGIAKDYIYGIFNGEFFVNCTIDGVTKEYHLSEVLGKISASDNGHIRITGHSMGGAAAQCLAYYLVKGDLYKVNKEQIEVYTFASPIPFSYETLEDDTYRNMNVYNFINVNDIVPDVGVSMSDLIVTRLAEEGGAAVINTATSKEYNGGYSIAGTNMGTNIYVNSDDLVNWTKSGVFGDHDMYATYMKLVEGYVNGTVSSYELDTDLFYSDFYNLNGYKNLASFADTAEDIVKVLKIGKATVKAGTWGFDLLDKLGMLE